MDLIKAKRILNADKNKYTDAEVISIIRILKEIIKIDINKK
jgi:hypothetical protein